MPIYRFHVEDGTSFPDKKGQELPDIQAARAEAVRLGSDLLLSHPETFWTGREWKIIVTNREGDVLFFLQFLAVDAQPQDGGKVLH